MLMLSEMWSQMRPFMNNTVTGSTAATKQIDQLGDSFFYFIPDSFLVILYFGMIMALFISALYEAARPETLPIGLLFIIVLILVTFPLSDMSHAFYTNPGFANVVQYYSATEYLADNSPLLTSLFSLAYIIFVVTKKQTMQQVPEGQGIVSG